MAHPTGETESDVFRLDFDRRLMLQFRGSAVTSDAGFLAYRELDDALGLTEMAGETLADARTGRNGRHALVGLLRQSVFGRLAGYEDVNDAERLRHDPAMRWIVGGKAAQVRAASPSQTRSSPTCWAAGGIRRPDTGPTRPRCTYRMSAFCCRDRHSPSEQARSWKREVSPTDARAACWTHRGSPSSSTGGRC